MVVRGLEHGADASAWIVEVAIAPSVDRGSAGGRVDEAEQDPERRRLPRPVRSEEAGDPALPNAEAQAVDCRRLPKALAEVDDLDHAQHSTLSFRILRAGCDPSNGVNRRTPGRSPVVLSAAPP